MRAVTPPVPAGPPLDPLQQAEAPTGFYKGAVGAERRPGVGRRRLLGVGSEANFYHVMSRASGGAMLFGELEKEAFVRIMRRLERFAGVEILTYAMMGNHFHLLVRVPERSRFLEQFSGPDGEERLFEHLLLLYSKPFVTGLRQELADLRRRDMVAEAEELLERFRSRLCDLSVFVKELKERCTRWFNRQHGRRGTLWMQRFKSVVVGGEDALRAMACYIDLNPVRAGLVEDPKDYRWCGYAEAVAGGERAQRGLCMVVGVPDASWDGVAQGARQARGGGGRKGGGTARGGVPAAGALYRSWLFEAGVERQGDGKGEGRRGVSKEARDAARTRGGRLSRGELLRCRVRYFSDGLALGDREFIEELFEARRGWFGVRRTSGARRLRELDSGGLFTLRALQVRAVE